MRGWLSPLLLHLAAQFCLFSNLKRMNGASWSTTNLMLWPIYHGPFTQYTLLLYDMTCSIQSATKLLLHVCVIWLITHLLSAYVNILSAAVCLPLPRDPIHLYQAAQGNTSTVLSLYIVFPDQIVTVLHPSFSRSTGITLYWWPAPLRRLIWYTH